MGTFVLQGFSRKESLSCPIGETGTQAVNKNNRDISQRKYKMYQMGRGRNVLCFQVLTNGSGKLTITCN
jgi:hypothetical protein